MSIKLIAKNILQDIVRTALALLLRFRYWRTICKIRKIYGTRKVIVAFCVSEISKWKSQSLYDLLEKSDQYCPVIFVYPSPLDFNDREYSVEQLLEKKVDFFLNKNMEVKCVWDSVSNQCIISKDLRPNIVFYQQPWDTPQLFPLPSDISDYALTFYIPYFLINNLNLKLEVCQSLHRQVFGHIVQNEEHARLYDSNIKVRHYAGKHIALGHTIVDNLTTTIADNEEDYVIYAPHFSIPMPGINLAVNYSTFLDNGELILEFAKQHPEVNWVFKPHPRLEYQLKNIGGWSDSEVDAYYAEWAKVGVVCETSDYIEHFQRSSAMITDCGSFLTEYSCMDKPLIRLYYHGDNLPPHPILEKLYSTFYYAHNNEELQELLKSVIIQHQDPNKDARHEEVVRVGLNQSNTSEKIIHYLDSLLSSK